MNNLSCLATSCEVIHGTWLWYHEIFNFYVAVAQGIQEEAPFLQQCFQGREES